MIPYVLLDASIIFVNAQQDLQSLRIVCFFTQIDHAASHHRMSTASGKQYADFG
jgi:hypothetical protein